MTSSSRWRRRRCAGAVGQLWETRLPALHLSFLRPGSETGIGPWPRAVAEAGEAECRGIDDRPVAGDEIGDEPPGARADAEAVAREASGDEEAGNRVDRRNDRHRVGHHVDEPGPVLDDPRLAEHLEGGPEAHPTL